MVTIKCDVCSGLFKRENLVQVVYLKEPCKECESDLEEIFACSIDCGIKALQDRKEEIKIKV